MRKISLKTATALILLLGLFSISFFLITKSPAPSSPIPTSPIDKPEKITATTTFLVFGDSGTGEAKQKELAQVMLAFPFGFILHTGDVAYPRGTQKQLQENFLAIYREHLAKGKIYPSPGNHDYQTANLGPYLDLFDLPQQALKEKDNERYYSFDVNNIHFVALDTNTPLDEASKVKSDDMADWLERDLQKAQDKKWKIVFFHHPPYTSGKEHGSDVRVRKILVPILEKYQVDLVFSGHGHNFERTCPLKDGTCSPQGVIYVVTGGGGGPLYNFGPKADFTISRSAQYHFVSAAVSNCQLEAQVINIKKEIIDTFSINKCQ